MNEDQQFCLKWNNFQSNILNSFKDLHEEEDFVDVTISCEGRQFRSHKMILSACSPYFRELLKANPCSHPIIIMNNVSCLHMEKLLTFIYTGQVNITQNQLSSFLKTAEILNIKGLADSNQKDDKKEQKLHGRFFSHTKSSIMEHDSLKCVNGRKQALCGTNSTLLHNVEKKGEDCNHPTIKKMRSQSFSNNEEDLENKSNINAIQPKIEVEEFDEGALSRDEEKYFGDSANDLKASIHENDMLSEVQMQKNRVDGYIYDNNESGYNSRPHCLDPRPCPVCGRIYSNLSNLRQHMRIIHTPQTCQCPLCLKSFKTELYLRRHLVSFHDVSRCYLSMNTALGSLIPSTSSEITANTKLDMSLTNPSAEQDASLPQWDKETIVQHSEIASQKWDPSQPISEELQKIPLMKIPCSVNSSCETE